MQAANLLPGSMKPCWAASRASFAGRIAKLRVLARSSRRRGCAPSYQRAYFAPALFNWSRSKTDLIASMAVDAYWRLYYNESWMATHTVEENAALLIHEVGHLLRDHEAAGKRPRPRDARLWNTAADCEINDDLAAEGLPLPGDPPQPGKFGFPTGETAELY